MTRKNSYGSSIKRMPLIASNPSDSSLSQRSSSSHYYQQKQQHFVDGPSTLGDVVLGIFAQIARKYLFLEVKKRALVYFLVVFVLSAISEFTVLPDDYYFTQKHNFINRFVTKVGWLWMCLLLVPFIWLTSLLHHGSRRKAFRDLSRLVVATFQWYFWTNGFVNLEKRTGLCHGIAANISSRGECAIEGGKWIPGFDISGHTFIFLYSILIIGEETCSFRNWPSEPRRSSLHTGDGRLSNGLFFLEYQNYQTTSRIIQLLFLAIFALHLIWDFQLVITLLYYHTILHKIFGALIAIFCWAVTYRFWYPMAFPFSPIRRHAKTFETKHN